MINSTIIGASMDYIEIKCKVAYIFLSFFLACIQYHGSIIAYNDQLAIDLFVFNIAIFKLVILN
jgi:hypothetical protein